MKATIWIALTVTATGLFAQPAPYSNASLKGPFVMVEEGFLQITPFTALGSLQFDGAGNVSGSETMQAIGVTYSGKVRGTHKINDDGTGSMGITITTLDDNPFTLSATYTLQVGARVATAERADNGVIAICDLRPAVTGNSSTASLKGNFIFRSRGYLGATPFALVGGLTTDGIGNASGNGAFQSLGLNLPVANKGTYLINADGTGWFTLNLTAVDEAGSLVWNHVINYSVNLSRDVARGLAQGIRTDAGTVGTAILSPR